VFGVRFPEHLTPHIPKYLKTTHRRIYQNMPSERFCYRAKFLPCRYIVCDWWIWLCCRRIFQGVLYVEKREVKIRNTQHKKAIKTTPEAPTGLK